jgi:hypothetical protein
MNEQKLDEICTALTRIESKLDASADQFAAHVADDALLAHDVRMLAKRQRGYFVTGLVAVGAGIAAATDYAIKSFIGSH